MKIQGYEFQIDKFVEYLNTFKDNLKLLYNWEIPKDKDINNLYDSNIISNEEKTLLLKQDSFNRNIKLKDVLKEKLNNTKDEDKLNQICKWIIKDWGGIGGFKDSEAYKRVMSFKEQVENNLVYESALASISKVLSFTNPQKYSIYDARVAYALNWIILKHDAADSFFAIPEGRNSKMNAFNMNTLIHLKKMNMFNISDVSEIDRRFIASRDKTIYIDSKKTYPVFCELIAAINENLWSENEEYRKYPYYTEMLLFAIADTYVIKDIIENYNRII